MSVLADIVQSWRGPSKVLRRHLQRGKSEAFAFTFLVVFLLICLVAQWPEAARVTVLNPEIPVVAQLLPRALALLATIPVWYALAALGKLAVQGLGRPVSWYAARVALFWALVSVTPLVLLMGLIAGMIGPGRQMAVIGGITFALFMGHWVLNLREAGRKDAD